MTTAAEKRLAKIQAVADDREREIKRTRRSEAKAWSEVERLEARLHTATAIRTADTKIPNWLKPRKASKVHRATPVLLLSDLHLDEVVEARDMDGMNEYNREIAEARLQRVVEQTVYYLKNYVAGVQLDGVVVALLGDIITGDIHEELMKTNEAPVPATVVHWVPLLAGAIKFIADELDVPVFVPMVNGNHDRIGKRINFKNRAEESFAWIIYNWIADTLRDDKRITFGISESAELLFPVYDTSFLAVHGDAAKGGNGIAGLWPPISRYVLKKQSTYSSLRKPFDYALMGHFHKYTLGTNFIINGSLKGYDDYARGMGFDYERPQQALFLVTPERGITLHTTIHGD